jgi:hypothetical protein
MIDDNLPIYRLQVILQGTTIEIHGSKAMLLGYVDEYHERLESGRGGPLRIEGVIRVERAEVVLVVRTEEVHAMQLERFS